MKLAENGLELQIKHGYEKQDNNDKIQNLYYKQIDVSNKINI